MTIENDSDVFDLIDGDEFDLTKNQGFVETYQDTTLKNEYNILKTQTEEQFGVSPASYVGYIEESPELWNEVNFAADETGVDPNLLYMIGMQEGFGSSEFWKKEEPGESTLGGIYDDVKDWWNNEDTSEYMSMGESYKSKEWMDSYDDVGLDIFFNTQDRLLQQGFLKNQINPKDGKEIPTQNEKGLDVSYGIVNKQDGWIMTGALIRQNESWMKNSFNNRGADWEGLSQQEKTFWTYASFNGGPGLAMKIYDKYNGSMDEAIQYIKDHKDMIDKGGLAVLNYYKDPDNQAELDHIYYLDNILRVVGGEELIDFYDPFEYEKY